VTYVVETAPSGAETLHDLSARELRVTRTKWEPEGWRFQVVTAGYAHRWVKNGRHHATDLWVDYRGRIRKSASGEDT